MVEVGAQASLLVRGGPNNGVVIKLTNRPITLGRRQDNDVVIDETTVSRRHSLILDTHGGFVLRDLNTTNGTYINKVRIGENEHPLHHGDQIKLGGSDVTLVFQQDATATVVAESNKTPPHGIYISETAPPCDQGDAEPAKATRYDLESWVVQGSHVIVRDLPAQHQTLVVRGQHRLTPGRPVKIVEGDTTTGDPAAVADVEESSRVPIVGSQP